MRIVSGIIIQARMGSTRLKDKVLRPLFGDLSILDILTTRLKSGFPDLPVIIATTNAGQDNAIQKYCEEKNLDFFRGNETNVLSRFLDCAQLYGLNEYVVRVCADNPFLDIALLKGLINTVDGSEDYITYSVSGVPTIRTHFGFFAEVVSVKALKAVKAATEEPLYTEHVTNYIYTHNEQFVIKSIELKELEQYVSRLRLTIDTIEDFENARVILEQVCPDGNVLKFDASGIVDAVGRTYGMINKMENIINANIK